MVKRFSEKTPGIEMVARRRCWREPDGRLRVYRRDGRPLRLWVDQDGILRCPCESGSWDHPCYHATVALRRLLREGFAIVDGRLLSPPVSLRSVA